MTFEKSSSLDDETDEITSFLPTEYMDSQIGCIGFCQLYVLTMREVGITLQVCQQVCPKLQSGKKSSLKLANSYGALSCGI